MAHFLLVTVMETKMHLDKHCRTYLTNFWRTFVIIFAEWAILLLGSLKVRALCAIYLASHINAERRLWIIRDEKV